MNSHTRKEKRGFFDFIPARSMVFLIIIISTIFSIIGFFLFRFNYGIEYIALKPSNFLEGKYIWTLLTHMFVHGGIFHLFVNMFVLFSIGSLCEKIIGRKRFLWFYILSGIFAGLLSVLAARFLGHGFLEKIVGTSEVYMVGASGAIFALAGLFVVILPNIRFSIIFLPFFSLPGYLMVPLVLLLTWVVSFFVGLNIGNVAHFGGFLVGITYGFYLRIKYKRKILILQRYFR